MALKVMIFAGEASGDMYGGRLAVALKESRNDVNMSGVGGDAMEDAGVDLIGHIRDLSVMGIWEVIRDFAGIRRILRRARETIRKDPPDVLVLIDFYRFNIELAREAKRLGIPVLYYVAPKLWVWGGRRIRTLKRFVDRILAIFPFEEEYFRSRGMPVTYVGNPLIDLLKEEDLDAFRSGLALPPGFAVISLLPGSRLSEVRNLLPPFLSAARVVARELGGEVRFLLPVAHTIPTALVEGMAASSEIPLTIVQGDSRKALAVSDAALVASGTATLEAFLLEVPQVVAYRASWLSFTLGKRIVRIPRVSLPNILAGRDVVEEFLQNDVVPERLAKSLLQLLGDERLRKEYRSAAKEVRSSLRGREASRLAARSVLEVVRGGRREAVR